MVVIENEGLSVFGISQTADAPITRTQITIGSIFGYIFRLVLQSPAASGTILPVRCHDYPFFAQRMPTLFPNHKNFISVNLLKKYFQSF
jgi:hypothetical protein